MEINTNGKHYVFIFRPLIKSSCPEGTAFYTQGLFNKQVCLTSSAQPLPALGLAGCYWLQPAALRDRTSCLLCPGLKASLMAELDGGPGLQTSSQLQDRKPHTTQSQHSSIRITHHNLQDTRAYRLTMMSWDCIVHTKRTLIYQTWWHQYFLIDHQRY